MNSMIYGGALRLALSVAHHGTFVVILFAVLFPHEIADRRALEDRTLNKDYYENAERAVSAQEEALGRARDEAARQLGAVTEAANAASAARAEALRVARVQADESVARLAGKLGELSESLKKANADAEAARSEAACENKLGNCTDVRTRAGPGKLHDAAVARAKVATEAAEVQLKEYNRTHRDYENEVKRREALVADAEQAEAVASRIADARTKELRAVRNTAETNLSTLRLTHPAEVRRLARLEHGYLAPQDGLLANLELLFRRINDGSSRVGRQLLISLGFVLLILDLAGFLRMLKVTHEYSLQHWVRYSVRANELVARGRRQIRNSRTIR